MDAATRFAKWDQLRARRCRAGRDVQPLFEDLESFKDWLSEELLWKSQYQPRTECSLYPAPQIMVMGVNVTVVRAAGWVWGCPGVPSGWDLFDPSIRIKAGCGNPRCVNFDHLQRRGGNQTKQPNRRGAEPQRRRARAA